LLRRGFCLPKSRKSGGLPGFLVRDRLMVIV
jgi:hypothetical protein